jgi:hypothetical protein
VSVLPASGNNVPRRVRDDPSPGCITSRFAGTHHFVPCQSCLCTVPPGVVANGAMLSKMTVSLLGNLGFDDVADLSDGYQAWATR